MYKSGVSGVATHAVVRGPVGVELLFLQVAAGVSPPFRRKNTTLLQTTPVGPQSTKLCAPFPLVPLSSLLSPLSRSLSPRLLGRCRALWVAGQSGVGCDASLKRCTITPPPPPLTLPSVHFLITDGMLVCQPPAHHPSSSSSSHPLVLPNGGGGRHRTNETPGS